jgi:hypothetical protein
MAQDAIGMRADLNGVLYANTTPLLLTVSKGYQKLSQFLMDRGAKVKQIGGTHHHKTPLSEALIQGHFSPGFLKRLDELDQNFTKKFQALKQIVHQLSVMPPSGRFILEDQMFLLPGYRPRYILERYLKTARPFYDEFKAKLFVDPEIVYGEIYAQLSEETKEKLRDPNVRSSLCKSIEAVLEAMENALLEEMKYLKISNGLKEYQQTNIEKILDRLDHGKQVVCFNITNVKSDESKVADGPIHYDHLLHAWGFVCEKIDSDTFNVKFCDRGILRPTSHAGIVNKNLSREKLTILLKKYHKAINWKRDFLGESGRAIKKLLDTTLELSNSAPDSFKDYIPETFQAIGNCCHKSAQSLELAVIINEFNKVLNHLNDVVLLKDVVLLAKNTKSQRTQYHRIFEISELYDMRSSILSFSSSTSSTSTTTTSSSSTTTSSSTTPSSSSC